METDNVTIGELMAQMTAEAKQLGYLALDTGNLKECALSFDGIPVGRREF